MINNCRRNFCIEDLFKLIPVDFEWAEFVATDEEMKFVCPSGSVYIVEEDGVKKFWKIYLLKMSTTNKYPKDV